MANYIDIAIVIVALAFSLFFYELARSWPEILPI
jgi:hypothetical protein